jgi:signal transduction histidine kinase
MKMRRITFRFVLFVVTAAVIPLALYAAASIFSLQKGTTESVQQGNLRVAEQVAAQVGLYMSNNARVLEAVGTEFESVGLGPSQAERTLKDCVIQFPEFREITIFDRAGQPLATSTLGRTTLSIPPQAAARDQYIAPIWFDDDGLPTTTIVVRLTRSEQQAGWVAGEIALESLWKMIDRIRVGREGYALIVGEDNRLIAHGSPDAKRYIADADQSRAAQERLFASTFNASHQRETSDRYVQNGTPMLAVAAAVPETGWTAIVEQPTAEAFETERVLARNLAIAITFALLATILLGYLWGRSFIQRIFALTRVTRAIGEGRMDERVAPNGSDEIRELGDAFNSMADKLVELQENIRKQERLAMFGKIASGLVHDLSHPMLTISNQCKLIVRFWDDADVRETFQRTFEREFSVVKRVFEDLQNIAKPIPMQRFPVELNRSIADVVESMQALAETAGITLRAELAPQPLYIEADLFALGRVYRNLIVNAIQATAPGGLVVAAIEAHDQRALLRVYDTGCGIPPERLQAIFEDFVTTKRRGLGLGLAISRKIVEQLGGRISVASEVGKGTTFTLEFPLTSARPMAQAAG